MSVQKNVSFRHICKNGQMYFFLGRWKDLLLLSVELIRSQHLPVFAQQIGFKLDLTFFPQISLALKTILWCLFFGGK